MANTAGKDKEVKNGMHEATTKTIEYGSRDVADALCYNPVDSYMGCVVKEGLESNKYTQSHQYEARSFKIAVVAQTTETHHCTHDSRRPHKGKESPSPKTFSTQHEERDGRVAACYVPIDCSMVPTAQDGFRAGVGQGMIEC